LLSSVALRESFRNDRDLIPMNGRKLIGINSESVISFIPEW